jgi:heat shock protein HspQ
MEDLEIQIGQKVQDRISGFTGIVTKVGDHITGCERLAARPIDNPNRGDEEFFYPQQLEVLEEETEFTDDGEEAYVDHEFQLGQRVRDDISGFIGVICVINYRLWNCPTCLVREVGADGEPETHWCDVTQLSSFQGPDATDVAESTEENEASNTGAMMDSAPSNLSK